MLIIQRSGTNPVQWSHAAHLLMKTSTCQQNRTVETEGKILCLQVCACYFSKLSYEPLKFTETPIRILQFNGSFLFDISKILSLLEPIHSVTDYISIQSSEGETCQ